MVTEAAEAAAGAGLLTASFLYGMRHGIDVDHLAAIADITGLPERPRRSLLLASFYAIGHAVVLSVFGAAAIVLGRSVPPGVDTVMQRFVGGTLVALGLYLAYQLVHRPHALRLQSRWGLAASAGRSLITRFRRASPVVVIEHEHEHSLGHHDLERDLALAAGSGGRAGSSDVITIPEARSHSHRHRHVGWLPVDPFEGRAAAALGTGAIHGVGAETPTQILLFVTAAGATTTLTGIFVLVAFVVGLFLSNTLLAIACVAGFRTGRDVPLFYLGLVSATSLLSIVVGSLYLAGRGDLPARLFGG